VVDGTYSEAVGSFLLVQEMSFWIIFYGGITAFNFSADTVGMNLFGYFEETTIFNLTLSSGEVISTMVNNPQVGFLGFLFSYLHFSINDIHLARFSIICCIPIPCILQFIIQSINQGIK
jgi:hypothetical protein